MLIMLLQRLTNTNKINTAQQESHINCSADTIKQRRQITICKKYITNTTEWHIVNEYTTTKWLMNQMSESVNERVNVRASDLMF